MGSTADQAKGRAKEALGDLTDDREMQQEGKADQATGKVKEAAEKAKDAVGDAADRVKDAFTR